MHLPPALPAAQLPLSRRGPSAPLAATTAHRTVLAVQTAGYLVPQKGFVGRVHSVFAQACNLACNGTLLTVCAPQGCIGPLTLRLADDAPQDLRERFEVGERIDGGQAGLRTHRTELQWARAALWRPAEPRALLVRAQIEARLHVAATDLAQCRRTRPSIVDGAGATAVAALQASCRTLDDGLAARQVKRLIGWGEGLTPAGDDFLVGLLAGLDALTQGHPARLHFRDALAAAVVGLAGRTTSISAHCLRLAAGGHVGEPLLGLRDALTTEPRAHVADEALHAALAIGATSGADAVTGLLAALAAWVAPV
jgi:hypothetical protein